MYSRTSRMRPPKISSLCGRLREMVAFEKSYHKGGLNFESKPAVVFVSETIPPYTTNALKKRFSDPSDRSSLNPSIPRSDRHVKSPYIFNTVSSRQVTRMRKIINHGISS